MCPAIHINSRSWLRSSSTREPSDPPLRVFTFIRPCRSGQHRMRRSGTRAGPSLTDQQQCGRTKTRSGRPSLGADAPEGQAGRLFEPRGQCSPQVPVGEDRHFRRARYPDQKNVQCSQAVSTEPDQRVRQSRRRTDRPSAGAVGAHPPDREPNPTGSLPSQA